MTKSDRLMTAEDEWLEFQVTAISFLLTWSELLYSYGCHFKFRNLGHRI
jgi:hypothetical protein